MGLAPVVRLLEGEAVDEYLSFRTAYPKEEWVMSKGRRKHSPALKAKMALCLRTGKP